MYTVCDRIEGRSTNDIRESYTPEVLECDT